MPLADKQRRALIKDKGPPALTLEFDVWADGAVSMWTHLRHGDDYRVVLVQFRSILNHLQEFIRDGDMCPFAPSEEDREPDA